MIYIWYTVALAFVAIATFQPELIVLAGAYLELQLKRLWLLLRLWPRLQYDYLVFKFKLWQARHNQNNRDNQ